MQLESVERVDGIFRATFAKNRYSFRDNSKMEPDGSTKRHHSEETELSNLVAQFD